MQQRRRIYSSLALWSEKRRASAEALAAVIESFEANARATSAKGKPQAAPRGAGTRRSRIERDAA